MSNDKAIASMAGLASGQLDALFSRFVILQKKMNFNTITLLVNMWLLSLVYGKQSANI